MTATLNREHLQRLQLTERMMTSGATRVDRDGGVIQAVKIIGTKSANGREYPLDVLRKAAPLYEGVAVNVNHPAKANDNRSVADRFGTLRNVRAGVDGLYGDLQYIRSHALAEQVLEMATRMPTLLGLSHNADGSGRRGPSGGFVVEEINRVISVDLVCDPATNKSLFESLAALPRGIISRETGDVASVKPRQSVIDDRNKVGASQAGDVIKKLYARLVTGVVNDAELSAQEKSRVLAELLDDQEYAIGQILKFGRFYMRGGPLPGDPVTTDPVSGEEVLAESADASWRGSDFMEHLRRAEAGVLAPTKGTNGGDAPQDRPLPDHTRGEHFMEHLRRADLGTMHVAHVEPSATMKSAPYERGKNFIQHLRGGEVS